MLIVHHQEVFTVYVQKLLEHIHMIMCIRLSNFKQFYFQYNTHQFMYIYSKYILVMDHKHPRNM
jgi:hypothetical protein